MVIHMKTIDVHGLLLHQAIVVIKKAIDLAYKNGDSVLNINHGFNNGKKIKSWCLNNLNDNEYVIKIESGENEGITKVFIKLNLKVE